MSPDNQSPDPAGGGRYERLTDGSLKQTHCTDEAPMRAPTPDAQPTDTMTGHSADTKE